MEKAKPPPTCPECGWQHTMFHQWDDRKKICMRCQHKWTDNQMYPKLMGKIESLNLKKN